MYERRRALTGILLSLLVIAFCFSPQFRAVYNLPSSMRIIEGEPALFSVNFPLTLQISENFGTSVRLKSGDAIFPPIKPVFMEPVKTGKSLIEFKLLGIIPIRTVEVDVLPPIKLIPGGQSIGVVLHSQGVITVGISPVRTTDGISISPAKDAGINVGDVILSINGVSLQSDTQLAELVDNAGQSGSAIQVLIKRGEERIQLSLKPQFCTDTKRFRIGLFVRDSAAGVGTLTFWDESSQLYGALGHVITDSDTSQPIDCDQGKIVLATVSGIQQGKRGQPGEKIGVFIDEDQIIGDIQKNTQFGIYGKMHVNLSNNVYSEPLPVASMNQIQLGSAEILTVINGQTIERFSIEIQKINLQDAPEGKGLVIKVTDSRLLEKTGGIVQGMSGSPIIQQGKLIGAVTHVFVHDPTKGYGCFIDWMLMESGVIPKNEHKSAKQIFSLLADFKL